jgi:hypothetical protein
MSKILNFIFGNKDVNLNKSIEGKENVKSEIQVLLKYELDNIIESITEIKCIDDFFTFYNNQILIKEDNMFSLISKGMQISGVVNDAIKLKSYIDTIDRYISFLESYRKCENKNIFLRFFKDRNKDLFLVFCDYSSVFNGNSYANLYVHGIYQYSNLLLKETFDDTRMNIHVTYNYEHSHEGYTLEVNRIKSSKNRRRCFHGQIGIESLKMLASEINAAFKHSKKNEKCIVKIFGYISPDKDDIPYPKLVEFYEDKCKANILNNNFEINVKV